MDEIEIIHIPCDSIGVKQARLIELLLELAKDLNIEANDDMTVSEAQEAA